MSIMTLIIISIISIIAILTDLYILNQLQYNLSPSTMAFPWFPNLPGGGGDGVGGCQGLTSSQDQGRRNCGGSLPVDARAAIGKASAVFPVAFVALEAAITAVWVTSDGRRKNEKKRWQRWLTHPIFLVPVLS